MKWFDRKFDFSKSQNIFPSIIERLEGSPIRIEYKVSKYDISNDLAKIKVNDSWSIKENIGHLIDLELLWQGRLEDILNRAEYMRSTDLNNTATDQANHNIRKLDLLIDDFQKARSLTLETLRNISNKEVNTIFSLHPRLHIPMSIHDLFLFVAEHDDHHLARITEIYKKST